MKSIFDLWPEKGEHCLFSARDGGHPEHHWVSDRAEAEAKARELDKAGCEVYFAPAAFEKQSRKQEMVVQVQSLWIDIDCGPKKPYAAVQEGLAAFSECVTTGRLPPPSAVVQSGHGLHAYWKFSEPIVCERWKPLAEAFKAYLRSIDLKIDPACTADGARVMRVPGTHNRKTQPLKVEVHFSEAAYDPAELEELTRDFAKPESGRPESSRWTAGMEQEFPPARIESIEEGCAQMAHVKAEGGAVSEPLWRAALSVLWRCEGGKDLIHEWSKGDPRYDTAETTAKADGTQGPYTCETFAELGGDERCTGCPHKGKVKSPIILGQSRLPALPVVLDGEVLPPGGTWTDERLAAAFTHKFADRLRYVAAWGVWMIWDGRRWRRDETLEAKDLARRVCQAVASQAKDNGKGLGSRRTIDAVEALARADRKHAATVDQWDADPLLLNTPGGMIMLGSEPEVLPHDPERHQTRMTAVAPDFEMDTPLWDAVLDRITGGDVELQAFLQRVMGYGLTGETGEHAVFFLYGKGANGKSVFVETVAGILGDYRSNAPVDTFMSSSNDRHSTELARMQGARLVTATETPEGRRWDEAKIKALTGGDMITARFMRQDDFEFKPQFKLVISGNHKPGLRSVDEAMRRRMHLIPFDVTIPPEERDPQLFEKLRREWPGILAWMVKGFMEWRRIGLAPPASVRAASDEYLEDEDSFGQWLEGNVEEDPSGFMLTGLLYADWQGYCIRAGEHAGTERQFSQKLRDKGFERHRTNTGRGFKVRLVKKIWTYFRGW